VALGTSWEKHSEQRWGLWALGEAGASEELEVRWATFRQCKASLREERW
jgi:hypothetical protein